MAGWISPPTATTDDQIGAIEHQLYGVPFVNLDCGREDSGAGKSAPGDVDTAAFRKRLWNATMNGQSRDLCQHRQRARNTPTRPARSR